MSDLEDWGDEPEGHDATEEAASSLQFGSIDGFVLEYLRNVYRRRIDGHHRCRAGRWWQYDEAVLPLEALWRSWEHLRLDPATRKSVWWRDHADPPMAASMDPDGPFAAVTEGEENTCKRGGGIPCPMSRGPRDCSPTCGDSAQRAALIWKSRR